MRKLFSQNIKKGTYEVAKFGSKEKVESIKLLVKYAKKYSLKTLDAVQLSVMKSKRAKVKTVVSADEKFCEIIKLEGFQVINPMQAMRQG